MLKTSKALFLVAALGPLGLPAAAAVLPSTTKEIRIDGRVDPDEWSDALPVDLDIETEPGENIEAPVATRAYIVEDGKSLFLAFVAEDPEPDRIRAYLRDRDAAFDDDYVGIVIDTFGDRQRAFQFFVNPLGVQMDLTLDDINDDDDESWNAIWDSAGRITDTGYVVEMEIPLNQLRFPTLDGAKRWGIDFVRIYPREQRYRLASNARDRAVNCYLCQLDTYEGLDGVEPGRDLEIVPTLVASQTSVTDQPGVVPLDRGDPEVEAGVSIRWGITPDVTANLAINPDFSQVEADAAQLDVNNQFALFFPETRPFFLEGADFFSGPVNAVFTRTIADPDIGAKLTGRRGQHTFGVVAARDEITNLIFPGAEGSSSTSLDDPNDSFVGRYSYGFGDASTVGTLFTLRQGDGYHNYVGGFDTRWRISDRQNLRAQILLSDTEYPDELAVEFEQPLGAFDGHAATVQYDYETRNWFVYLRHNERTRDFRADAGFVPRVDFSQQIAGVQRIWWGSPDDRWARIELGGDWDITYDDAGRLLEREVEAYFEIEGLWQSEIELFAVTRDLRFENVLFEETQYGFSAEAQPISGLGFGLQAQTGDRIDFANARLAERQRLEPFVNWNVNRHLLLRLSADFVTLDSKAGPNIFEAELYDVRMTWQFSVRSFFRFTTQIQDVTRNPAEFADPVDRRTRDVARQFLYSYELNPQTVFFLGYSDVLFQDDSLESLESVDQAWFMKIGYAFMP